MFELQADLPEATLLTSESLRLTVLGERGVPVIARAYVLPKRWQVEVRPENVVVNVVPVPLGDAGKLSATAPRVVPPPKVRLPKELTPAATVSPDALRVVTPAPGIRDRTILERTARAQPPPSSPTPASPPPAAASKDIAVRKRTDAAVSQLPAARLAALAQFKYGIKEEDKKLDARGPGATPINLLEDLRAADDARLTLTKILKVFPDVYQNRNPNAGVFYYRPAGYFLEWTPDSSYGMRML